MGRRKRNGSAKKSASRFRNDEIPKKYWEWRRRVLTRDERKCQMPGCCCNSNAKIQVHHIIRWADDKSLRYNTDNGICLCKKSHQAITGKEELFEELFVLIVQKNKSRHTKTSARTNI